MPVRWVLMCAIRRIRRQWARVKRTPPVISCSSRSRHRLAWEIVPCRAEPQRLDQGYRYPLRTVPRDQPVCTRTLPRRTRPSRGPFSLQRTPPARSHVHLVSRDVGHPIRTGQIVQPRPVRIKRALRWGRISIRTSRVFPIIRSSTILILSRTFQR